MYCCALFVFLWLKLVWSGISVCTCFLEWDYQLKVRHVAKGCLPVPHSTDGMPSCSSQRVYVLWLTTNRQRTSKHSKKSDTRVICQTPGPASSSNVTVLECGLCTSARLYLGNHHVSCEAHISLKQAFQSLFQNRAHYYQPSQIYVIVSYSIFFLLLYFYVIFKTRHFMLKYRSIWSLLHGDS